MGMRIIVTGSRRMADGQPLYDALNELYHKHGPFTLVHGACAVGADFFAHHWYEVAGRSLGVGEIKYKADWQQFGKPAGPRRNARMVAAGADLVLAFPGPTGTGTQHTMTLARAAGIEVKEIPSHE